MNMHVNRRNPAPAFRSKRLTTFRQIGMRRDELLGMCRDRELNLRARVGPIFAPKKKADQERQCANVGERQAENDQPYRQTVGRLILPGVHPPATLSIRPERDAFDPISGY